MDVPGCDEEPYCGGGAATTTTTIASEWQTPGLVWDHLKRQLARKASLYPLPFLPPMRASRFISWAVRMVGKGDLPLGYTQENMYSGALQVRGHLNSPLVGFSNVGFLTEGVRLDWRPVEREVRGG